MSTSTTLVIADRVWAPAPDRTKQLVRTATLVTGFALLTAALAQFEVKLSFTPVPITGQTLGVLLAGAALGWRSGAMSMGLYWVMGLVGLPFYSGGDGGWKDGTGATMGYLVGFIVAAAAVGYMAERKQDRNLVTSVAAMAFGTVIIYAFGAAWLAHNQHIPVATGDANAIAWGVTPFLIGDAIKMLLAGAALPAAWALTRDR